MSIEDKINAALPVVEKIAEIALTVAKLLPVTASVANAIEMGIKIEQGLANEVPAVIATYNDMKSAAAGGVAITTTEWAEWQAGVDSAHSVFVAAAAKVEAS